MLAMLVPICNCNVQVAEARVQGHNVLHECDPMSKEVKAGEMSKMLPMQTSGPRFDPQKPCKKAGHGSRLLCSQH